MKRETGRGTQKIMEHETHLILHSYIIIVVNEATISYTHNSNYKIIEAYKILEKKL
jgi:hypothetical protein